jgi:hypothetical protein
MIQPHQAKVSAQLTDQVLSGIGKTFPLPLARVGKRGGYQAILGASWRIPAGSLSSLSVTAPKEAFR